MKYFVHRRKTKVGTMFRLMVILPDSTTIQPTLGYDLTDEQIQEQIKDKLDLIRSKLGLTPEPGADVLFREIVPLYLLRLKAKGSDAGGRNKSSLHHHILPHFGDRHLKSLLVSDGDAYVGKRLEAGAAKGTVLRECNILSAVMNYAILAKYLTENPFAQIARPVGEERARVASMDELLAIAKVATRQLNAAIMIALTTLQRQEKVWGIDRTHVANYGSGYLLNVTKPRTKTKGNVPQMPLNRLAMAAIHWEDVPSLTGRVFHTWSSPAHLSEEFGKACKRVKVHDLTYHDLRHTGATALQDAGVDPMTIEKMLGHSLGKVLGRYQHSWLERYAVACKRLDEVYAPLSVAMGLRVIGVSSMSKASVEPNVNALKQLVNE